jgi:D-amino peptidase
MSVMNQNEKKQGNFSPKKTLIKSGLNYRCKIKRLALTVSVLLLLSSTGFAQLKIYINTDLEGISGVYHFGQTREKGSPANIQACEFFMEDLAAVIRGLRDGGATEIVVFDGHGNQSMLPHMMVPGATYITGKPKPNLADLDSSFVGMVMLGFHAMNGTPDGVLHHTQSSLSENKYWYNGVESGELVQNAVLAGYYDVPFIMVTGDEATCREARHFFGDDIVTVATKKGYSREAAELYPFDVTRKALYEGARKAIATIPKCKPYKLDFPVKAKKQQLVREKDSSEPKLVTVEKVIEHPLKILDL